MIKSSDSQYTLQSEENITLKLKLHVILDCKIQMLLKLNHLLSVQFNAVINQVINQNNPTPSFTRLYADLHTWSS